jgi:hypothetical protein
VAGAKPTSMKCFSSAVTDSALHLRAQVTTVVTSY